MHMVLNLVPAGGVHTGYNSTHMAQVMGQTWKTVSFKLTFSSVLSHPSLTLILSLSLSLSLSPSLSLSLSPPLSPPSCSRAYLSLCSSGGSTFCSADLSATVLLYHGRRITGTNLHLLYFTSNLWTVPALNSLNSQLQ